MQTKTGQCVVSPKKSLRESDYQVASVYPPCDLLPHQKGYNSLEEEKPNTSNLKGLNFILPQDHPHYDILMRYIHQFDGSINNNGNGQTYEIHYDKAKYPQNYHSDLIFGLIYNRDIDTRIYQLKNYKQAKAFSHWTEETLEKLDIRINFSPTYLKNFWLPDNIDNEKEIESFILDLCREYNKVGGRCMITNDSEHQNRRFVYVLLDVWTDWLQKLHQTTSIRQYMEKYIRNIDSRYGYGFIDVVIGEDTCKDLNPNPVYLIVETKAQLKKKHHPQIIGELLAYAAAINFEKKKEFLEDKQELSEVYGILCDGFQIQFFMVTDFSEDVVIDMSEVITIGAMKNNEFERLDIEKVVRILFSIGSKEMRYRPNGRRSEMIMENKVLKEIIEKQRGEIEKQRGEIEKQRDEIEKQKKELNEKQKTIEMILAGKINPFNSVLSVSNSAPDSTSISITDSTPTSTSDSTPTFIPIPISSSFKEITPKSRKRQKDNTKQPKRRKNE
jgi:hypothetical protein